MKLNFGCLSKADALAILNTPDEELPALLDETYETRKRYKGNRVGIHLLTNARSGDCTQNCTYCAQSRAANSGIAAYTIGSEHKLMRDGYTARDKNLARHCIGLSGIGFKDAEIEAFAVQIRKLKHEVQTPVCCSIGFLTPGQAKMLKEAGVDRINHNLNTSERFYPHICTTHTYQERIDNIKMLQDTGFEICCGGIIGLGEDKSDVVDMLFAIQTIQPQAVPINFLLPVKGTPLEYTDVSCLTAEYCLKVLCLARLLIPAADIRCAAGREVYLKGREKEMLYAADSIFASGYLTVDGQCIDEAIQMVKGAGFEYVLE